METRMRRILTLMTVVAAGGLYLGLSSHDAEALPSSAISAPAATPTAIENAQYYTRRPWWRRQEPIVVPKEAIETDPNLAEGGFQSARCPHRAGSTDELRGISLLGR